VLVAAFIATNTFYISGGHIAAIISVPALDAFAVSMVLVALAID
jgi:hypothetical protein